MDTIDKQDHTETLADDVLRDLRSFKGQNLPREIERDFPPLLKLVQDTRLKLHLDLYSHDEALILAFLLNQAYERQSVFPRKQAGKTAYDHVREVARNIIVYASLTDLASIGAALGHDDIEDIKAISRILHEEAQAQALNDFIPLYRSGKLKNIQRAQLKKLRDDIYQLVCGLTKYEKAHNSKKENADHTLFRILEVARNKGLRVLCLKLCDRLDNAQSLDLHNPERRARKLKETWEVFVPMAGFLGQTKLQEALIRRSLGTTGANPEFLEAIKNQELEIIKQSTEHRDRISNILGLGIESVQIEPFALRDLIRIGSPIEDLAKLSISEIIGEAKTNNFLILVDDTSKISRIVSILNNSYTDNFSSFTVRPFPDGTGTKVQLFSSELGGMSTFNIVQRSAHQASLRGVIASDRDKQDSPELRKVITGFLDRFEESPSGIVKSASQELLQTKIYVKTPNGEIWQLPFGATGLDFAKRVAVDVLTMARSAEIFSSSGERLDLSLFDKLPDGASVKILDRNQKTSKSGNGIDPAWLYFCHGSTRSAIVKHLESRDSCADIGRAFLANIAKFLKTKPASIASLLGYSAKESIFLERIGSGKLNLLEEIAKKLAQNNQWNIKILLENRPGTLELLSGRIASLDINIDGYKQEKRSQDKVDYVDTDIFLTPNKKMSNYNFLIEMLRLKYAGYDIQVNLEREIK